MGMVETSDSILPISKGFVPGSMGHGDGDRPKEPFHLVVDRTQRRRLEDLRQVVTKELASPCTVQYLPKTGQIVLAPQIRVVRAVRPEPTTEERLTMAVWRIRSLHLSRRCGTWWGTCRTVWYRNRCIACFGSWRYRSPGRSLPIRETTRPSMVRPATSLTALVSCTSVDHPYPQTSCTPGTDGYIGCLLRWMVHRGIRPRTSIARLVAPPVPTNYLVGGY